MKVLWITSTYPNTQQPGMGVFHETQVQALVRLGLEVTVICPTPQQPPVIRSLKKQYRSNHTVSIREDRKGVTVYRPPYLALPGQLRWAQPDQRIATAVLKTMSDFEIKPDIIHAHFAMPSGGAARIVASQKNLPWVLTLHGSDVNVYPHYSSSAKKAFIQAVQSADSVLSVASHLRQKAEQLTGKESTVLPIGIDLTRFKETEQSMLQIRKRLYLPESKKLVVFVGRLTESKGVYELTKAIDLLPYDTAVIFVGEGPARTKISRHPEFNKRLFITGQLDNDQVRDYISSCDVFALPSYSEGMPTVVIEAIALGAQVVSTDVGGVPELFGEHKHLLINKMSVTDLASRIIQFLSDELYSPRIQQALLKKVQNDYDVELNASKLIKIYKKTIESDFIRLKNKGDQECRKLQ